MNLKQNSVRFLEAKPNRSGWMEHLDMQPSEQGNGETILGGLRRKFRS